MSFGTFVVILSQHFSFAFFSNKAAILEVKLELFLCGRCVGASFGLEGTLEGEFEVGDGFYLE